MTNKEQPKNTPNQKFTKQIREVIKGFHRRIGKKGCSEMNSDCHDCQTRWAIGILNSWLSNLDFWEKKKYDK